jgi:hypothetical protein
MSAFSNREVCPKCDNDYSISKVGERRYCEDCGWQGGADEVESREVYSGPIDLSHLRHAALTPEEIQPRREQFWKEREERDRLWAEEDAANPIPESVDVPTDPNQTYGVDPETADYSGWTSGNHGKGHFIDGVPYSWNTNKMGGPEHMHHLKYQMGLPPEIASYPVEGYDVGYTKFYINPDGTLWNDSMAWDLAPEQLEVLKGMGHVPEEEKQEEAPSQFGHAKNVMDILNRTSGFWDEENPKQIKMRQCPECGSTDQSKVYQWPKDSWAGGSIACLECDRFFNLEADEVSALMTRPIVEEELAKEGWPKNGKSKVAKRLDNLFKESGFWDEPNLNQTTMVPLCESHGTPLEAIWTERGPLPYCSKCAGGWRGGAISNDPEAQRATEMWFSNPPDDWMRDLVNEEDPNMGYSKARALANFMHEYRPGEVMDTLSEVDRWKNSALMDLYESEEMHHEPGYSKIVSIIGEVPYADNPEEAETMWREGKMADWGYPYVEGEEFDFDRWSYEQEDADQQWSTAAMDILLETDPEFNTATALADALRYP